MKCLKCQKEYNPKRSDKLFCGESCGNAYRQQQKRDALKKARLVEQGEAIKNPVTETEQALWTVLTEVMKRGDELNFIFRLPLEHVGREGIWNNAMAFIGDCKRMIDRPVVQEIEARLNEQAKVEARIKDKHEKQTTKKAANNKYKQSDGQQTEKPDNA